MSVTRKTCFTMLRSSDFEDGHTAVHANRAAMEEPAARALRAEVIVRVPVSGSIFPIFNDRITDARAQLRLFR